MPRAGRRRSVVWACFVENTASGKRRVLCRFCQHDLVANPIRMVRHIVTHCPHADEQHKKICREYQALTVPLRRRPNETEEHEEATDIHASDGVYSAAALTPSALSADVPSAIALAFGLPQAFPLASGSHTQSNQTQHRVSTSIPALSYNAVESPPKSTADGIVERIHEELALALATTNDPPLQLLANPHFARVFQLMNVPALSITDLESRVVPRIKQRVESETTKMLEAATTITVQLTANGKDNFNVFAADQDQRQVALENLSIRDVDETLESLIWSRLSDLPRKASCPLYLCVDAFGSAPSLVSTLSEPHVAKTTVSPVLVGGCLMQASLSLLARVVEVLPRIRLVVDVCALMSERTDLIVPPLDSVNLWSLLTLIHHVLDHKEELSAADDPTVRAIIENDQFWSDAAFVLDILRPFGFLLVLSDNGPLAASIVLVSWLLVWATGVHSRGLAEAEITAIGSVVLDHIQCYGHQLALVCLALDPRCRGLGLSALGKRKVRTSVVTTAQRLNPQVNQSALLAFVVNYLNRERPFDDESSWQMMASLPRLFWVEYATEAPELTSVALGALSFRPFIHSLQHTWEVAQSSPKHEPSDQLVSTLKTVVSQLSLLEKHDHRKPALVDVERLLISDVSRVSSVERANNVASYASVLPVKSTHSLWSSLDRIAQSWGRDELTTETIDVTWFAVDATDAVHALQACLQRTLFGDEASDYDPDGVQGPVSSEESEMLSGLEGL